MSRIAWWEGIQTDEPTSMVNRRMDGWYVNR